MKRIIIIGFLALWGFVLVNLVGCAPVKQVNAGDSTLVMVAAPAASLDIAVTGPACAAPTPEMIAGCQAQAERILASTVRLEFHGPGDIGHATVIGGRYLITHNHYSVSGEALSRGGDGLVSAVSVLKANGNVILLNAPLSYFSVVLIAPEVLVLDFREYSGVGFFDSLGVPSAEIGVWGSFNVQPGSEVAQIDWDGTTARVVWVRVASVHPEGDAPTIELDSFVEHGASGGGVFYNGFHIANNWSRKTDQNAQTGEILRKSSLAVLNTPAIALNAPTLTSSGD